MSKTNKKTSTEPKEEPTLKHGEVVDEWEEPDDPATLKHLEPVPDEPSGPTTLEHVEPIDDDDLGEPETVLHLDAVEAAEEAIAGVAPASSTGINPKLIMALAGGFGLIAIIAVIIGVVLINGRGWSTLSSSNPSASHPDGITVALNSEGSLKVKLGSIPREAFLNGEAGSDYEKALQALPSYLEIKSPIYNLEAKGDGASTTTIVIPNDSQPYETLDLYQWDSKAGQWLYIPGHVNSAAEIITTDERAGKIAVFQVKQVTPLISTRLEGGQLLTDQNGSTFNMVFPTGVQLQPDGTLNGALIGGWKTGAGYAVIPVVFTEDSNLISSLINNPPTLALHLEDLKSFVIGNGYNGVALDYRNVKPEDREAFGKFIEQLGAALKPYGKLVVVFVPAPDNSGGAWNTGGYDWRTIGTASDAVVIRIGNDPNLYTTGGQLTPMLNWAVGEINRLKIHVAFSSLSVSNDGSGLKQISYDAAIEPFGGIKLMTSSPDGSELFSSGTPLSFDLSNTITDFTFHRDTGIYSYGVPTGGSSTRQIWLITADTIRRRLDLAETYRIGGIEIDDLLSDGNDSNTLTAVNQFKANTASSVPNQLIMKWTVNGASGAVASESTGIGTPLVWQATDDGQYIVQANLVGGRVSDRGAVTVNIGSPESTPTPTKAPPRVVNSGGNNNNPPATTQQPAPPPSVGGAGGSGGFEYGGQVPSSLGPASYMQRAGMSWVKFQAKWPYVDAGTASSYVASGHAAGFKVLLSIPGPLYPQSIDFNAYTEHLRAIAGSQPDAIEVWNEMNLDREWPTGQLDPASYVNNMLAPAFNAIKSVSPNTMVIIGALAPTGFDNGTNAWSDQRYLQGLAAAGAANYANCVGAHHNSGTTSPSVRSGRTEGDHYSWYFLPTLEVTHNSIGGTLPVCLTEFGYLTPEGYGPLPTNFSWGGNTSVAQQAAWLKEGRDIARGLGWVRLMIIWNVGFTQYDSDPQAGYSIIRPDGSCPACDALGQ